MNRKAVGIGSFVVALAPLLATERLEPAPGRGRVAARRGALVGALGGVAARRLRARALDETWLNAG